MRWESRARDDQCEMKSRNESVRCPTDMNGSLCDNLTLSAVFPVQTMFSLLHSEDPQYDICISAAKILVDGSATSLVQEIDGGCTLYKVCIVCNIC